MFGICSLITRGDTHDYYYFGIVSPHVKFYVMFLCGVMDVSYGVLNRYYLHKVFVCKPSYVQIRHKKKTVGNSGRKVQKLPTNQKNMTFRDEGMLKTKCP